MHYSNKKTVPVIGDRVRSSKAQNEYDPGTVFSIDVGGLVTWGWRGNDDPDSINIDLESAAGELSLIERPVQDGRELLQ